MGPLSPISSCHHPGLHPLNSNLEVRHLECFLFEHPDDTLPHFPWVLGLDLEIGIYCHSIIQFPLPIVPFCARLSLQFLTPPGERKLVYPLPSFICRFADSTLSAGLFSLGLLTRSFWVKRLYGFSFGLPAFLH